MLGAPFPFSPQLDRMDCGPACLQMISKYYGKSLDLDHLRRISFLNKDGVSLLNLSEAAEKIGFKTLRVQIPFEKLIHNCPLPCILHWKQDHFIILYKIKLKGEKFLFSIADPAHGLITIDKETFLTSWISSSEDKGVALILTPNQEFFTDPNLQSKKEKNSFSFLLQYLRPYTKLITLLVSAILVGSLISLFFPLLTQILVDSAIGSKDYNLVVLILLSQLLLFLGDLAMQAVKTWLLLNVNTRLSISIISDFLAKMMKLPLSFFELKSTGDITQRVQDHHLIDSFLTGTALNTVFSIINLFVVSLILLFYNGIIFLIFLALSVVSVFWITLFLKARKRLDYQRFLISSSSQDALYEIIFGIQEIKLNGGELTKRWEWERIQNKQFRLNIKGLALAQYQRIGFLFINQLKNIIISFVAATQTIDGLLTLGMMLSISYITGLANSPLEQLIEFFRSGQDASLSVARLKEVHNSHEEDQSRNDTGNSGPAPNYQGQGGIQVANLSFQYGGPKSPFVLRNINLHIPENKTTAIVGASGSGKTTLLKLLLKFYDVEHGTIIVDGVNLKDMSAHRWRKECGVVMQDGYIFSDSIARNIALDGESITESSMLRAVKISNIQEHIDSLPLGFNTRLSANGGSLSEGQRQRILISRAVYKSAKYLFFDEATSSLDANNERIVTNQLDSFLKGRTSVIIAHRLSTVKNADQIVVLERGTIVEVGTHETLVRKKGYYFELIKNQLELGA